MASPRVLSSDSGDEEDQQPLVWDLSDDSVYTLIGMFLDDPKMSAGDIDELITTTAALRGYRLGQRSFSTSLHCDPRSHRPSLFMMACMKGRTDVAIHLLIYYQHFININHQEWFKHPCLTGVHLYERPEATRKYEPLLVSPFHAAAASGAVNLVNLFVAMGVDVNVRTCCQLTPLHMAATSNRPRVVKYLLRYGACVDATDRFGNTPLLASVWYGPSESIPCNRVWTELLKGGANSFHRNHQGHSLVDLAALKGNHLQSLLVKPFYFDPLDLYNLLHKDGSKDYPLLLCNIPKRWLELLREMYPKFVINYLLVLGSLPGVARKDMRDKWREALIFRMECKDFPDPTPKKEYGGRTEMAKPADLRRVMRSRLEQDYQRLIILQRCMKMPNLLMLNLLQNIIHVDTQNRPLLLLQHTRWFDFIWKQLPLSHPLGYAIHHFSSSLDVLHRHLQQMLALEVFDFCFLIRSLLEGLEVFCSRKCLCENTSLSNELHQCLTDVLKIILSVCDHVKSTSANDGSAMDEVEALCALFMTKFFYVQEPSLLHSLLLSNKSLLLNQRGGRHASFRSRSGRRSRLEKLPLICALLEWGGHSSVNVRCTNGCRPIHEAVALSNGASDSNVHEFVAVVTSLLDAGAHVDALTSDGRTAFELCTRADVKAVFEQYRPEPLTCLASRIVVIGGTPSQESEFISPRVKAFISLHDPVAPH